MNRHGSMNRAYRLIWSAARGIWIPVSASGLSANHGNYLFSYAAGNAAAFHVTPATLTYTATAASIGDGQAPTGLGGVRLPANLVDVNAP